MSVNFTLVGVNGQTSEEQGIEHARANDEEVHHAYDIHGSGALRLWKRDTTANTWKIDVIYAPGSWIKVAGVALPKTVS